MRKILAALLCAAILLSVSGAALAEEANPNLTETSYTLELNGTPKDLGGLEIMSYNGIVMVPLRLVSEALGFSVAWFGDTESIRLDNGTYSANIIMNTDYYYSILNKTKAMTTPVNLGIGPMLINGSTYVPADFFGILYRDTAASQITDGVVRIKAVSPSNSSTQTSSLDEAIKKLGFMISLPSYMPDGYQLRYINVVNNTYAEVYYTSTTGDIITLRIAAASGNISGDNTAYSSVNVIKVGSTEVVVKGFGSGIRLAYWTAGNLGHSITFTTGISETELRLIIASIT